jgi:hypothetical protein
LDTSGSRSEIPVKFWSVVLGKDGKDQLDQWCENEEALYRVKEERKANWIGHIWHTKCLLKHNINAKIERRIEVVGRRGTRWKQLLDDLKETRGFFKVKAGALDCTLWRIYFRRRYGPVIRQTTERMNKWISVLYSQW